MNFKKEQEAIFRRVREFFGYNDIKYVPLDPAESAHSQFRNEINARNTWTNTLLKGLVDNTIILCGGAITSAFSGDPIKDLDFYVEDSSKLKSACEFIERYFPKESLFQSINANTWTRNGKGRRKYRVQLITKFTGSPEKIFDDFDFTVTQGCYRFDNGTFVFGERFLQDVAKRVIVFCGKSHYPICAMYRTLKYQRKGYKLSGLTVVHIALAIARLEITTYRQLKEQLFGIDTMFLQRFLEDRNDDLPVDYASFVADVFAQEVEIEEEENFDE